MKEKTEVITTLFKICFSVAIYFLMYLLVLSLLTFIPGVREWNSMYVNAAAMGLAALAVAFTISGDEIAFRISDMPILKLAAVILLAYSASAFFNIVLGLIPWQQWFEQKVTPDETVYYAIPLWARMICYEMIAPIAEELLFRQVLYTRIKKIVPVWIAVLVSALFFGIYHGNLVQGLYAFIMGALLALVYEWTKSFAAPVLFHMVANHVSDICYEVEEVGNVVYSLPAAGVWLICMFVCIFFLIKKQNKCSKNTLHSQ